MLRIIPNRKWFFAFSGAIILVSIIAVLSFGFKMGIDFIGGTSWQLQFSQNITTDELSGFFKNNGVADAIVTKEGSNASYIVRFGDIPENAHQELLGKLNEAFGNTTELRFDSIGPAIGKELRDKALWAIVLVILGISLYIAYAFREVSYPVSSWKYGAVTLFTLFHDVIVPIGVLAVLGKTMGVEVDSNSVVAVLVVMGFSVHDTIVVFDRIRESLRLQRGKIEFESLVNKSVNETLARSVNTSLTLVLVLIALLLFGPVSLKYFLLALLIGVVTGTYSSIFIASPMLVQWARR